MRLVAPGSRSGRPEIGVVEKLRAAAGDPGLAFYAAWSGLHGDSLFRRYRRLAHRAGLDRLYLIFSFDCDTAEDIEAAWPVHRKMMDLGVMPAYAVPGELLAQGAEVYRRISATGAEFLNHGYRSHTFFDEAAGTYKSCFFYDEQTLETVEADVIGGDRAVADIIGMKPRGFRTPHFGTFQSEPQLEFLHGVLAHLNYEYSTSTSPRFGLRFGPLFERQGLREIPVSGCGSRPWRILDSWGCFQAPDRRHSAADYRREALGMAARLDGGPGILNYYADPSHIAGEPVFFETVAALAELTTSTTYGALLERLR